MTEFDTFDLGRGGGGRGGGGYGSNTDWLMNSITGDGEDFYDDYDYDDLPDLPDEWESMDPKYVNDKRVLINLQIK